MSLAAEMLRHTPTTVAFDKDQLAACRRCERACIVLLAA
jgi:hypothetical protein